MAYYDCVFSGAEWDDVYWILSNLCDGEYGLSYDFFIQFFDLEKVDIDESWVAFVITKQELQDMDCEDLTEDDWWFIRTTYDCFSCGFERIHIDVFKHIVIRVGN